MLHYILVKVLSGFPLGLPGVKYGLDFRQQNLNMCVISFLYDRCNLFSYIKGSFAYCPVLLEGGSKAHIGISS